ncbi:MAG: DUF4272 domain-containing protein [Micromonosporaceae bacterium]
MSTVPTAPDPAEIRSSSLEELERLEIPLPPDNFPLTWEPGDAVRLRGLDELQARVAVLTAVMERCFGMPSETAMQWLLDGRLLEHVSRPEWQFLAGEKGDRDSFMMHLDALFGFAWLLGWAEHLDPSLHSPDELTKALPNIHGGESYADWLARSGPEPRDPQEAAALLDLYYCLDWAYQDATLRAEPAPGSVPPFVIAQRRWALEWAVVFEGPYHEAPPGWEEVDLST